MQQEWKNTEDTEEGIVKRWKAKEGKIEIQKSVRKLCFKDGKKCMNKYIQEYMDKTACVWKYYNLLNTWSLYAAVHQMTSICMCVYIYIYTYEMIKLENLKKIHDLSE